MRLRTLSGRSGALGGALPAKIVFVVVTTRNTKRIINDEILLLLLRDIIIIRSNAYIITPKDIFTIDAF